MASYEEDHGISRNLSSSASNRRATENENEQHSRHRVLLSQQPDLNTFFNMDRDDDDHAHTPNISRSLNNDGTREEYTRALLGALSNYSEESDLARELSDELRQELEQGTNNNGTTNNTNNRARGTEANLSTHQAALLQNIFNSTSTGEANGLLFDNVDEMFNGSSQKKGVSQEYLDSLDRVPKKSLKKDENCPICATPFLDDEYPLVVRLPCSALHKFDLECVGPWLTLHADCPLCRKNLLKKNEPPKPDPEAEEEEEEEFDDFYG